MRWKSTVQLWLLSATVYTFTTVSPSLSAPHHLLALGMDIAIPSGWSGPKNPPHSEGPVVLDNFHHRYYHGGIIPKGGADITITRQPLPAGGPEALMRKELSGVPFKPLVAVEAGGESGIKTSYDADYGSGSFTEHTSAVYVPHEKNVYKLFLSYRSDDPRAQSYEKDFDGLLARLTFTR